MAAMRVGHQNGEQRIAHDTVHRIPRKKYYMMRSSLYSAQGYISVGIDADSLKRQRY